VRLYALGPSRVRQDAVRRRPQRLDRRRNLWQRIEPPHQAQNLFLGAVFGPRQNLSVVFLRQVRAEQQDAGEVNLAGRDLVEQNWKFSRDLRRAGATKGFVLGEPKFIDAIRTEGGASAFAVNAARLDFGEMGEQRRAQLIRAADQATRVRVDLVVR
jgi:hypothetical protein